MQSKTWNLGWNLEWAAYPPDRDGKDVGCCWTRNDTMHAKRATHTRHDGIGNLDDPSRLLYMCMYRARPSHVIR